MALSGDPPAVGWYDDPTGRHELRWFSVGSPTELVRDSGLESRDGLSVEERTLPATAGPGLELPGKTDPVADRLGPAAWWDTAVPRPGEPTVADIGIAGATGYEIVREARLVNRLTQRWRSGPRRMAVFVIAAAFLAVGVYGGSVLLSAMAGVATLAAAWALVRAAYGDWAVRRMERRYRGGRDRHGGH